PWGLTPCLRSDLAAGAQVAEAHGESHRLGPRIDLHPRDRVADVGVDRGGGEREPVGDLLDAQALREQFENLGLAGGSREQLLDLTGTLAELSADEGAAAGDHLDRAGDVLARRRLEHIAR